MAAPNIATLTDETGAAIDRYEFGLVPVALTRVAGLRLGVPGRQPAVRSRTWSRETTGGSATPTRSSDTASSGLDVGRRVVYDVAANWKLIVENFMECYHCATIHPELVEVLPEFADGLAAQYYVGHGAEFGPEVEGFTVDGSAGFDTASRQSPPSRTAGTTRSPCRPTVFINLVPDHVILHRMYPMAADRTIVECDWLYSARGRGTGP